MGVKAGIELFVDGTPVQIVITPRPLVSSREDTVQT